MNINGSAHFRWDRLASALALPEASRAGLLAELQKRGAVAEYEGRTFVDAEAVFGTISATYAQRRAIRAAYDSARGR
ncbi:hypothetical protein ABB55_03305 [Prosthecomicrobium hirschii]|uniref:Uncharacterized protein n=1 Tax=Prosthecodimorpha hirschii TaxID=665126 RepID=A0A0P6VMG1_9HYPH|nr:hypothetical protein [Prosthecomicrobium hirschii]KPL51373.1 hypothetical protein ABB55_03305 [Prosthecomicrobium hirschii]